jgi:peptidoglycan hydrolase-like protein with peptidoglycan-binding domain
MTGSLTVVSPARPTTAQAGAEAPAARARAQLFTDIQRELANRGFYDGSIDGIFGPKMDAAIREFEQASGRRPSGEPNEALLAVIKRSSVKAERSKAAPTRRTDGAPAASAPSRRVAAVQRALSDFGYGQLKLSGVVDEATKTAIEKFERERKLPVRGQLSDRLLRELAAVTGRPFE